MLNQMGCSMNPLNLSISLSFYKFRFIVSYRLERDLHEDDLGFDLHGTQHLDQ